MSRPKRRDLLLALALLLLNLDDSATASCFAAKKAAGKKKAKAAAKPSARGFGGGGGGGFGTTAGKSAAVIPSRANADDAQPKLVTVDLGLGKTVSVMVPTIAAEGEPGDEELKELVKNSAGLKAFSHLYGAGDIVWPASIALARMLAHVPSMSAGQRVLELGCGLGAAGLAAAGAGATSVLLTDRDEGVLEMARAAADEVGTVSTAQLEWTADDATFDEMVSQHGPFDLIIGADILYDESAAEVVAGLLDRLLPERTNLEVPPSQCLLADPEQRPWRAALGEACVERGLHFSEDPLPGPEKMRLIRVVRSVLPQAMGAAGLSFEKEDVRTWATAELGLLMEQAGKGIEAGVLLEYVLAIDNDEVATELLVQTLGRSAEVEEFARELSKRR